MLRREIGQKNVARSQEQIGGHHKGEYAAQEELEAAVVNAP